MTGEIFFYRPESSKVHRLNLRDYGNDNLAIDPVRCLSDQYVLLRDDPRDIPDPVGWMAASVKHNGCFKSIEVSGGGIGVGMARLFKGEVGGYVFSGGQPNVQMPWDLMPVWGISQKLGFVWLHYDSDERWLVPRVIAPSMKPVAFAAPTIVIHSSRLAEFESCYIHRNPGFRVVQQ
jgi:hypothetical protein